MPMTRDQIQQSDADYSDFIIGHVIAVEEARSGHRSTCDICGRPFQDFDQWGNLTRVRAAKQLVVDPTDGMIVRHYRLLVCRQGAACRARRREQIRAALRAGAVA